MVGLTINYFVTAKLLRAVTPSFGKLAALEAKLEVYSDHMQILACSHSYCNIIRAISALLTPA